MVLKPFHSIQQKVRMNWLFKKGITFSEKSKRLTSINIYVSNTPEKIVPMEQIHDFYSLRWQIEIIFKTWKSLFQIHHWQTIKQE